MSTSLPPQSVPPIDTNSVLFDKTWWLYFFALDALVNTLANAVAAGGVGYVELAINSNTVTLDLSIGFKFELVLNQAAQVTVNNPILTGGVLQAGESLALYVIQDATGNRPTMAWGSAFGQDVATQVLAGDPNTRSAYLMSLHSDNLWHLDSFLTGQPLS